MSAKTTHIINKAHGDIKYRITACFQRFQEYSVNKYIDYCNYNAERNKTFISY